LRAISGKGTHKYTDRLVSSAVRILSFVPAAFLLVILGALIFQAFPAIELNGIGFITKNIWHPGNFYANPIVTHGIAHPPGSQYGALGLIFGTFAAAIIAIILGVPVSVGAAIFVVRKLPARPAGIIGVCLEAIAGIPSVIFGLWGALVLGPFLAKDIYPIWANHLPKLPIISYFRGPTGDGEGLLTSGVVLAVMIVPIVASTTRDLLKQVPESAREGATALGLTQAEVLRSVDLRWVGSGILGSVVLGLARALGETMAVAMVSGSALGAIPGNIYGTMSTFASTIVTQLDSALVDSSNFAVHTLAEAGLILLILTFLTNLAARLLVKKVATTALPVGRGL
jgi:phosphate transport system permease protein